MINPFFSIGIPVYNAEKYLAECLDSILAQSFKDFEIVLVDDGSEDGSRNICMEYMKQNSCIKYFYKENGGISSACNMLLDNIRGRYFFQMDNDDTMCVDCLLNAYNDILSNNYPDILQCGYRQFAANNPKPSLERLYQAPDDSYFTENYDHNTVLLYSQGRFANPLWTKFIRVQLIRDNNIRFDSRYDSAQDSDFTIKCYRHTNKIAFGQFYTVNWIHPRSESVSSTRKFPQFKRLIEYHYDYINDIPRWNLTEEEKRIMIECFSRPMRHYTLEVFYMAKNEVYVLFEMIDRYFSEEFRKLPTKVGPGLTRSAKIIYDLYDLIGIQTTAKLVYYYLHKIKKT